jgi:MGT family glycosyltransferase
MRLLVCTVPLTGHVGPMLVLVRELAARGHVIHWYAGGKFAAQIEAAGARFEPRIHTCDWDDADTEAAHPSLRGLRGLARVKEQLRSLFIAPLGDELRDLEAIVARVGPAAVIADAAHLGGAALADRTGLPWVGVGVSALMMPSVDVAPFGSNLGPGPQARNKAINWLVYKKLFAGVDRAYRAARASAGVPATGSYFEVLSPDLFLQPTVPALEYPRSDLPPQVRFIGPLVPREPPAAASLPAWWGEIEAARVPIVLVTQGTLATDPRELIRPALRGLADRELLVVATTPVVMNDAPANARIASFVPYHALLPRVAVMVTNGGYGGVQMALAHGVPLVVAGASEEKPEIAARVAWTGAGIDLRTGTPSHRKVAAAVSRVLREPNFADRARAIAAEMATHDAAAEGAAAIEALVAARREVA